MQTVRVFTRESDAADWPAQGTLFDFERVPVAGEYLALASADEWYGIMVVRHLPNAADVRAEVWATRSQRPAELNRRVSPAYSSAVAGPRRIGNPPA